MPAFIGDQTQALLRVGPLFALCLSSLDPLSDQLGVGENSRKRVIDLMGNDRSHLSNRRHFFDMQDLLVRSFQLASLLIDTLF